ncbi:MAG: TerC family protein [Negativicutes bacterium]|nr:TerC family protein [Negativicutes bacterium]
MQEIIQGLLAIIFIDLVLAGDNAVVIALASRNLPPRQRRQAIIWGTAGAVGLRVVATVLMAWLITIPYLQFIGGAVLVHIAWKLLVEEKKEGETRPADSLLKAIKTIIMADFIMSVDNMLAVAGVAEGHLGLLLAGLLISIPLVVYGSTLLSRLMDRYPIIIYIGAAVLAYTAGKMMTTDIRLGIYLERWSAAVEIGLVVLITTLGYWRRRALTK